MNNLINASFTKKENVIPSLEEVNKYLSLPLPLINLFKEKGFYFDFQKQTLTKIYRTKRR